MRDHSNHIELSREQAVSEMLQALPEDFGEVRKEQVALDRAYGRILADDIAAKTDIPNCLTCAMDSIAVHWTDFEDLDAGEVPATTDWVRGIDWEFANTGVAMPEGFDTAIVIEHVEVSDDEQHVKIGTSPSGRYAGTREAGSNFKEGELIVADGTKITPDVAAQIASAGHSTVLVKAKPRVAFVPTGNELVPPNLPFSPSGTCKYAGFGKVFESNSAVVQGKVEAWGAEYVPFDIVSDDREGIREAVSKACQVADIVILNAGSSKGSDDWSVEVLEDMGEIICHQTNHGPGHHSSYSLVDGTPVVGISGPSGGASFTLNFYLLPLIKRFYGMNPEPIRIPARLTEDFPQGHKIRSGKLLKGEERPSEATQPGAEFFAVRFVVLEASEKGGLLATPVNGKAGSAGTQHANAYCMIPAGPGSVPPKKGDLVLVELRSGVFS